MQQRLRLPTLLLITDQAPVRAWFKKQLEEQFFLLEASTVQEALKAAAGHDLQFIILDASLEAIDLFPFCRELKKHVSSSLPFFLITGRLKKSFREAALDAGITDFLSDQLDVDELETRLATAERARLLQKRTSDLSSALRVPPPEVSSLFFKQAFLLQDQALHLIAEAKRKGQSLRLLLVRLDSFSSLDHQYGQRATQALLAQISAFLSPLFKETDLLIPAADGQWIVLLPNYTPQNAQALAETLQQTLHLHPFQIQQESFHVTVSIAFTSLDPSENAFHQMIASALKALKQAHTTSNLLISLDTESSL